MVRRRNGAVRLVGATTVGVGLLAAAGAGGVAMVVSQPASALVTKNQDVAQPASASNVSTTADSSATKSSTPKNSKNSKKSKKATKTKHATAAPVTITRAPAHTTPAAKSAAS